MPSVTVVIPVYNGERFLTETLDSVLAQTYRDWELVIVDDGSFDGTAQIAERYAAADSRVHVVHQKNSGLAAARNRGFREGNSSSEYIIFLDHDDLWEPETLSSLVGALQAHPEAVGAHAVYMMIDSNGEPFKPGASEHFCRNRHAALGRRVVEWPLDGPTTFEVLVCGNVIQPSVALLRRAVLDQVGPFDAVFWGCEDWDMWLRLSQRGSFAFLNEVLMRYRQHQGSMSSRQQKMYRTEMRIYRTYAWSPDLIADQRQQVRLGYSWRHQQPVRAWFAWAQESISSRHMLVAASQLRHALIDLSRYSYGRLSLEVPLEQIVHSKRVRAAWDECAIEVRS